MYIIIILLLSSFFLLVPSLPNDHQNPDRPIVTERLYYRPRSSLDVTLHDHAKEYIRSHGHAKAGDVPYQVSFKTLIDDFDDMYGSFCSGTLIQLDKILTAANCLITTRTGMAELFSGRYKNRFKDTSQIRITCGDRETFRTGESMELNGVQWRNIKNFSYHPEYKIPYRNIAVVHPETPFIKSFHVRPIKFAKTHKDYDGVCVTAGYGVHCNIETSNSLQILRVRLMLEAKCDKIYKTKTSDFICIDIEQYGHYNDTYLDDSGGPLVCSRTGEEDEIRSLGILVGISGGIINEYPAIYTRVSSYVDFIGCNGERNKAPSLFDKQLEIECFLFLHFVCTSHGTIALSLIDF